MEGDPPRDKLGDAPPRLGRTETSPKNGRLSGLGSNTENGGGPPFVTGFPDVEPSTIHATLVTNTIEGDKHHEVRHPMWCQVVGSLT